MTLSIPSQVSYALPVLITLIAGWLASAKLKDWVNDLILLAVFVLSLAACIALNPTANLTVLAAYCAAIVALMKPLYCYLVPTVSPFAVFVRKPAQAVAQQGIASQAATVSPVRQNTATPTWSRTQPDVSQQSTMPTQAVPTATVPAPRPVIRPTPALQPVDQAPPPSYLSQLANTTYQQSPQSPIPPRASAQSQQMPNEQSGG